MQFGTLFELLQARSLAGPDQVTLLAPGRIPMTMGLLASQVDVHRRQLGRWGIQPGDPVAIVMPNGPEMAAAFLSVAAGATAAPLNPNYRAAEFDFYMSDLGVKALLLPDGMDSPALGVAQALGVPVIRAVPGEQAGAFALQAELPADAAALPAPVMPEHVALVLHTSGTTSRPKIVPLSNANLLASAENIARTLVLNPNDRCLNVMPLFHIHGLMAALSASIFAGASVVCTPGFNATRFFAWLDEFRPTWYTAVPTMHQAILARSHEYAAMAERVKLRFVRSSSASLPVTVLSDLETLFHAPVIEAYGMTEATHQMACNPLPPGVHKPGTVGPAAGPKVAIMDEAGQLLAPGQTGEIVIQGCNVTRGYVANPDANAKAFTNGWFRTGDQGFLDVDGYLTISGRLKEIINRGGEKISPREVDEVLLAHPAVAQAVAFAVPDPTLGEEIAAAIVLRPGASVTADDLRRHAAATLADFKVPRRIVFLDEVPKGPTGKLQRIGLAEQLGIAAAAASQATPDTTAPSTEMEHFLHEIWLDVLDLAPEEGAMLGVHTPFFACGGDSMLATELINVLEDALDVDISFVDLLEKSTIAEQAVLLEQKLLLPT